MKKITLTLLLLLFHVTCLADLPLKEKLLSIQAWEKSAPVVDAIKRHPFNQEVMQGSLDTQKFGFYIEQDDLYLQDYARCLTLISARIEPAYSGIFLRYADEALNVEQDQLHQYFRDTLNFQKSGELTPATMTYTSYLLRTCALEPVEVAVAAILPCFWIYREVGVTLAKEMKPNNRYRRWIEAYSNKTFNNEVDQMIGIFDQLAQHTTPAIREKMLLAFYTSSLLEWYFWDEAYQHRLLAIKT